MRLVLQCKCGAVMNAPVAKRHAAGAAAVFFKIHDGEGHVVKDAKGRVVSPTTPAQRKAADDAFEAMLGEVQAEETRMAQVQRKNTLIAYGLWLVIILTALGLTYLIAG